MVEAFERRALISVDATGYGSADDQRQSDIQAGLLDVLDKAAAAAGLERDKWERQGAGDGEFSVLLPQIAEGRLVGDFPRYLAAFLNRRNGDAPWEHRLRLRLAIHYGTAIANVNGRSGQGAVEVARLCDSPPLRVALRESRADLAVILSDRIYTDIVRHGHALSVAGEDFREVEVNVKEFRGRAWLWIPRGRNIHSLTLALPPDEPPAQKAEGEASSPERSASVHNEFHERVDARGANFGFRS
ncbi:hypothetical protein [Bailinhaonella thermotolerans]|uniref:Guanylate cyclase domain-containing protein n=1 Tax=Bailinhaonella thermotolerans TaxID=1070861 RepID=A0A3A4B1Y4_9ACTN|nr:hypothetical protein [Bailinhaonella thermotolerans]RJL35745.1 hypothetical protein D5H75_02885 [Bailinhaonella thermotolerans]